MRILFHSVAPSHNTGVAHAHTRLAFTLAEMGHQVLYLGMGSSNKNYIMREPNLKVEIKVQEITSYQNTPIDIYRNIIRFFAPDIVWCGDDVYRFRGILHVQEEAFKAFGTRFVWQGVYDNGPYPTWLSGTLINFDVIACFTEHMKELWDANKSPFPVVHIPYDASPAYWAASSEPAINFNRSDAQREQVFGWFNRNIPRKNLISLLEAWGQHQKKHPKDHLILVTDPKESGGCDVNFLMSHWNLKNIILAESSPHSSMPRDELKALYLSCDWVLSTSCQEGFGMHTAEAMLCGIPIITTRAGGLGVDQTPDSLNLRKHWIPINTQKLCDSMNGGSVALIYKDFASPSAIVQALDRAHSITPQQRRKMGLMGQSYGASKWNSARQRAGVEATLSLIANLPR